MTRDNRDDKVWPDLGPESTSAKIVSGPYPAPEDI